MVVGEGDEPTVVLVILGASTVPVDSDVTVLDRW